MYNFCRNIETEGFQINIVKEQKDVIGKDTFYPIQYRSIFIYKGEEKAFYKDINCTDEDLRDMYFNVEDGSPIINDIVKEIKKLHNIL